MWTLFLCTFLAAYLTTVGSRREEWLFEDDEDRP